MTEHMRELLRRAVDETLPESERAAAAAEYERLAAEASTPRDPDLCVWCGHRIPCGCGNGWYV